LGTIWTALAGEAPVSTASVAWAKATPLQLKKLRMKVKTRPGIKLRLVFDATVDITSGSM
jgi:hypothetical protein